MRMRVFSGIFVVMIMLLVTLQPFAEAEVVIPSLDDAYCRTVALLESGQTDIDYRAFRESFLESRQFLQSDMVEIGYMEKDLYAEMEAENYERAIAVAEKILSMDYTHMSAHKALSYAYQGLGDESASQKYKMIEFGLLKSIVRHGDGKSCATAWPVIQTSEEYFILSAIGAELQKQTIVHDGGVCDQMEVMVDGVEHVYYFEVSQSFEGYEKKGLR